MFLRKMGWARGDGHRESGRPRQQERGEGKVAVDTEKRLAKWNAKFNLGEVEMKLGDVRPAMYAHVQTVFAQIVKMELGVKQVLDDEGVRVSLYPWYLDYGRELWKLQRTEVSGEALACEAATLIGKWHSRGLERRVLERIRSEVFNIAVLEDFVDKGFE